eukprot:c52401_g1_i1.p1 GENE.c52401_g1_i1~~c52401_g1_i1.p1  ORF type:complete len:311 (+),score=81.42 c52401_g1_i1:56-934(+)
MFVLDHSLFLQLEFRKCKEINVETVTFTIPNTDQHLKFLFPTIPEPHRSRIVFKIFKKESIFHKAMSIVEGLRHGSVVRCSDVAGINRYLANFKYVLDGQDIFKLEALKLLKLERVPVEILIGDFGDEPPPPPASVPQITHHPLMDGDLREESIEGETRSDKIENIVETLEMLREQEEQIRQQRIALENLLERMGGTAERSNEPPVVGELHCSKFECIECATVFKRQRDLEQHAGDEDHASSYCLGRTLGECPTARAGCKYNHFDAPTCLFGAVCTRKFCWYNHPPGWKPTW